jgi:hypothetical protein
MRFGKRQKDADPREVESVIVAAPEPPPQEVSAGWSAPSADPSAGAAPAAEAVVEGEAVELPPQPHVYAAVPPAAAFQPPVAFAPPGPEPTAVPFPAAEEPVAVVAAGAGPEHVAPLGAAAETFASGHGPAPAPAWPDGVQELVAERPEVVVGAAFVGGILAAMILRRLGN